MPRVRRPRKNVPNAVAEFEKEVVTTQKALEMRFKAVIQDGQLPNGDSDRLFRAMLTYALGPDFDLTSNKLNRDAKKNAPPEVSASKRRNPGRRARAFDVPSATPVVEKKAVVDASVSSDAVMKKGRRKKAVSIAEVEDTPVSKKNTTSKRKRSADSENIDPAIDIQPMTKKNVRSKKTEIVSTKRSIVLEEEDVVKPMPMIEDLEEEIVVVKKPAIQKSGRTKKQFDNANATDLVENKKKTKKGASSKKDTVSAKVGVLVPGGSDKKIPKTVLLPKSRGLVDNSDKGKKKRTENVQVDESAELANADEDKENKFAVSKDGKLSEAAINRFKKPVAGEGKAVNGAAKSIRLFKPVLRPAVKRGQQSATERRTDAEMRLAAKTPGMKKLDFGNAKAATSVKTVPNRSNQASSDVSADIIALSLKSPARNARKKISFALNPVEFEAPPPPPHDDEPVDEGNEEDAEILPDVSKVEDVADIEDEEPPHEPEAKKKYSIEPLFPPSIFADPSPAPKKKTISFAPGTKKRGSESQEPVDSLANSSKRSRPITLTGKSDLRKRIDSMRERMSQKSLETPGGMLNSTTPGTDTSRLREKVHETPGDENLTHSSGFFSANSRAKCSQSEDEDMDDVRQASQETDNPKTPVTGTASRSLHEQFNDSPTPERTLSIKTPARALEARFNSSSPDNVVAKSEIQPVQMKKDTDGDAVMNAGSASSSQLSKGPGVLSNLMTSVKSFLPSSMAIPGFEANEKEETEEQRTNRIQKERKMEEERREAETIARKEAAKLARQAEAREKQRRIEEKKKAMELENQRKEMEKKQKERARIQRLRQENEERKRKKAEEDRKRELRRQRVREHQEKLAAQEAAKRAELEKKLAAARAAAAQTTKYKKIGGSSKAPMSERKVGMSAVKGMATPGAQRQLFRKKSMDVTSYEMSADRERGNCSDDSSSESEETQARQKGKKIPEWATKNNVARAVEEQRTDPDKHFTRIQSVNLEDVFASTQQSKMRYRSRNSSGQWTKDRLTAREEMEYKKKSGYI